MSKMPEFPPELLAKFAEMVVPARCGVVIEVRQDGEHRQDDQGTPIRCGKPLHPALGCMEKFSWGGTHKFEGQPQKNMVFRDLTPREYSGPVDVQPDGSLTVPRKDGSSLNLDDVEYSPHPVLDGGVGSGGSRRLKEGDSGKRKRVVVDGEMSGALLRFLPQAFSSAYEVLVDQGYGERRLDGSGSMAVPEGGRQKAKKSNGRTSTSQTDKTLAASGGGKSGKNSSEIGMKNEAAVDFRKLIDRKLRRIAREIHEFLSDGTPMKAGRRQCSGKCRKIGDPDWLFCARCGGPMQEV